MFWYKLPIVNFLQKDLANTRVKGNGRFFNLLKLKPTIQTVEPLTNTSYSNLFCEYEITGKNYRYKALVKTIKLFKFNFYIVIASELEEID